jgi:hypothetical protein
MLKLEHDFGMYRQKPAGKIFHVSAQLIAMMGKNTVDFN